MVDELYDHRRQLDVCDALGRLEDTEDSGRPVLDTQRPAPLRAERPRRRRACQVSIRRERPSGSPGERDAFRAEQYPPRFDLPIPVAN